MLFAISANNRSLAKRRTYSAYRDDGPPCWANFLMFAGAVICFSAGFNLWVDAFFGTREGKVGLYGHKISNWTSYKTDLMRTNFSVRARIKDHLRPTTFLPKDMSEDVSRITEDDQNSEDLPNYSPLRFYIDSSPHDLLPTLNFTMPPQDEAVFEFLATYYPSDEEVPIESVMSTYSIPLWTKKVVPGATPVPARKCPDQQHGTWAQNKCEIYHRLVEICVLVDFDAETSKYNLKPQRNKDPNSYGCERGNSGYDGNTRWSPATYALIRATASYSEKTHQTTYVFPETTLDDVAITVRSDHDPYVEAEKATKGSLDFGMSAHNSLTTGAILLVVSICLCISPTLAMRQVYKDMYPEETSYASVHDNDDYDSDDAVDERPHTGDDVEEPAETAAEIELASLSPPSGSSRTLPRRPVRSSDSESGLGSTM